MEEFHQITIQEYLEWKEDLRRRLAEAANNFVGIGYRLKQIRDSKGYEQDGYTSVFDFAAQEFGISTSQASRFMAINDKFSKGGNSLEMPEEYTKLGPSKLSEMLTLPEKDYRYITEDTTREQIRELKEFSKHEEEFMNPPEEPEEEESVQNTAESVQKTAENVSEPHKTEENSEEPHETARNSEKPQGTAKTDSDHSGDDPSGSGILIKCLHEFLKKEENKRKFEKCLKAVDDTDAFAKALNPSGSALLKSGRYMLFLRKPGEMNPMKILGGDPSEYAWEEIREAFFDAYDGFISWEEAFAPAQTEENGKPGNADFQSEREDIGNEESEENQGFAEKRKPANADKQTETEGIENEESEGNQGFGETVKPGNADFQSESRGIGNEENEENQGSAEVVNPANADFHADGQAVEEIKNVSIAMQDTKKSAKELKTALAGIEFLEEFTPPARLEDVMTEMQEKTVRFLSSLQDWKTAAIREGK